MSRVELFTDGACLGNPGPGGWAALLRSGTKERELVGGEAETTNNRMELMAAIAGLEALRRPCRVRITTDSRYLMDGARSWLAGWKQQWLAHRRPQAGQERRPLAASRPGARRP